MTHCGAASRGRVTAAPPRGGRLAHERAELSREMSLVAETGGRRDGGDRPVSVETSHGAMKARDAEGEFGRQSDAVPKLGMQGPRCDAQPTGEPIHAMCLL